MLIARKKNRIKCTLKKIVYTSEVDRYLSERVFKSNSHFLIDSVECAETYRHQLDQYGHGQ